MREWHISNVPPGINAVKKILCRIPFFAMAFTGLLGFLNGATPPPPAKKLDKSCFFI